MCLLILGAAVSRYRAYLLSIALFNGQELPQIMDRVVSFCVDHEITGRAPILSYGKTKKDNKAELRFDPSYIQNSSSQ